MHFTLVLSVLLPLAFAQYPPVSNLTRITSPVDGNITISYKTPPTGTCQTVFDSQQQYTGWVNIPGSYATNTFFWFISARDPTDQLTIWLNGGPGSSSMIGLFTENGPCEVVQEAQGKFGTVARDWGWDRGSNILYIDQVCEQHGGLVAYFWGESRPGQASLECASAKPLGHRRITPSNARKFLHFHRCALIFPAS
jgi:hypothetical protein